MFSLTFAILVGVSVFVGLISKALYDNVMEMRRINHLQPIENKTVTESKLNQWAIAHDFVHIGDFFMHLTNVQSHITVWRHCYEPTFMAAYLTQAIKPKSTGQSKPITQKTAFDFVTYFEMGHTLTTGSTLDASLFPLKEGRYQQTFNFIDMDDLLQKHAQAVVYLKNYGQARLGVIDKPVEDYILEALHSSMEYVWSLPLWPVRGVYWYFIRRHLWHNLTIQRQHEKGKIRLPNEITV